MGRGVYGIEGIYPVVGSWRFNPKAQILGKVDAALSRRVRPVLTVLATDTSIWVVTVVG